MLQNALVAAQDTVLKANDFGNGLDFGARRRFEMISDAFVFSLPEFLSFGVARRLPFDGTVVCHGNGHAMR